MVEAQVAVGVAGHAPPGPPLDQRAEGGQGRLRQRPQPLEHGPAERRAHVGFRLLEVLAGVAGHHLEAAGGRDRRAGLGPGVERGDAAGQGLDRPAADLPAPEPLPERGLVGQPLHLHGPLDDLAVALHLDTRAVEGHGHDPEVDLRRQPAVEPDLLLAEVAAPLQRAVVEEPQVDRLLDLVGIGAGQEDDRDVGLADLDRLDRMRADRRPGRRGPRSSGPGPSRRPPRGRSHGGSSALMTSRARGPTRDRSTWFQAPGVSARGEIWPAASEALVSDEPAGRGCLPGSERPSSRRVRGSGRRRR